MPGVAVDAYRFRIVVELVRIDEFGGVETGIDDAVATTIDPARCPDADARDLAAAVRSLIDVDAVVAKVRP